MVLSSSSVGGYSKKFFPKRYVSRKFLRSSVVERVKSSFKRFVAILYLYSAFGGWRGYCKTVPGVHLTTALCSVFYFLQFYYIRNLGKSQIFPHFCVFIFHDFFVVLKFWFRGTLLPGSAGSVKFVLCIVHNIRGYCGRVFVQSARNAKNRKKLKKGIAIWIVVCYTIYTERNKAFFFGVSFLRFLRIV